MNDTTKPTNDATKPNIDSTMGVARPDSPGLVEEGEAFRTLARLHADGAQPGLREGNAPERAPLVRAAERGGAKRERLDAVVIGGGQAGLSVGYYLSRQRLDFAILEANDRIGDSWRRRWDSLRLFTPARFDALPGMPFPAPANAFPTKDEMAAYLESYATRFELPVRTRARVERVSRADGRYLVTTADGTIEADHVVVAMATFQKPRSPRFAGELREDITSIHSSEYRNPSQLRDGGVLLVGAGNSGAEIAIELARSGRPVWLSGRDTGHVPIRIDGLAARMLLRFIFRVVFHRLLTTSMPWGQRAKTRITSHGGTLIRVKPADLARAGVERVPRVAGVRDGRPLLEDGRVLDVANVIWCTGFTPGFSWIDLPVFDENGEPRHDRGVACDEPGLYFVGLHFLYALSSAMIAGVSRDAARIAQVIAKRRRAADRISEARPRSRSAIGLGPREGIPRQFLPR